MSKYFDQNGELRETDHDKCRNAFEKHQGEFPGYSLTRMYCGPKGTLVRTPKPGYVWMGYINRETQSDWCRFFDGWVAARKDAE